MNVATFNGRRLDWRGLLALLLLPVLVTGAFLGATWGFDANLRKVQAAIVNNDEMVELNGQKVPLGRQLSAALVDSTKEQNFTWVLADEANASRGLASGRYAAVVTIPKNFSAAVTSFAGAADQAHQATISIETSPVAGLAETALGQSIADAAARSLNTTMTKGYLDQVYLGFNENKKGMTAVADGAKQLADGTTQLSDGLGQAAAGGQQLKSGGAALADGARQLGDGIVQAADGAKQLKDGGVQLADGSAKLSDGLGQLADKTKPLPAGVSKLADGTDQLAGGLGQLAAAGPQLSSGAGQLASGASGLAGGVDTFAGGLKQYTGGVDQYVGGINQIVVPIRQVVQALPDLTGVLDSLDAVMADLPARATTLDAQVQAVSAQIRALLGDADALDAASGTVLDGLAKARTATGALASGSTTVACPDSLKDTPDACAAFAAGVKAGGQQASDALASVDATRLAAARAALAEHRTEILDALDTISAASTKLVADAPALQAQWKALRQQIPPGTSPNATLLAQLTQLEDGGNQLIAAGAQLNDGAAQLGTGAHQLADGAGSFATGLQQYTDGVSQSASGAGQLAAGVRQLADQLPQLVDGIGQLAAGASQLNDGVAQYTDGVGKLSDGLQQAAPGATQLADGVAQYTDGAGKLADGVSSAASGSVKLADGTTKLADGLASGVKQIPTYDDLQREKLSTVVAAPISTTGLDALVTPGAAGTSLLLVLALWLGALATYALIKPVDPRNAASSATTAHLMLRTLLPGAAVSAVQAAVLTGIGAAFLGLTPLTGFALFGALLLAGLAFTAVNHALAAWGGVWGRLASGVMLLITGVTALTYSAPAVFDTLRGLSAVSPGLDAARAIITGHSPALMLVTLAGWLAVGLLAGWYAIARSRTVSVKRLALAS